jgi:hypothetical protein
MAVKQSLQCALVIFSIANLCARMESGVWTGSACGPHWNPVDPFGDLHSWVHFFRSLALRFLASAATSPQAFSALGG